MHENRQLLNWQLHNYVYSSETIIFITAKMLKNIMLVGAYNYKHQLADLTACPCRCSPHRIKFQYFHCFDFFPRLPFTWTSAAPLIVDNLIRLKWSYRRVANIMAVPYQMAKPMYIGPGYTLVIY